MLVRSEFRNHIHLHFFFVFRSGFHPCTCVVHLLVHCFIVCHLLVTGLCHSRLPNQLSRVRKKVLSLVSSMLSIHTFFEQHPAYSCLDPLAQLFSFRLATMVMYAMTNLQSLAVYHTLSFSLASMMATISICGSDLSQFRPVPERCDRQWFGTFVATYQFMRILNSWMEAYSFWCARC